MTASVATRTRNTLAVRARVISPAFWTSDDICELPSDSHRVMFQGLWAYADREGRMLDEPGRIGRRVRAWDPKGAQSLIDELVRRGMVRRYEAEGKRCLYLPAFKKWQRVHPHEARSYLPSPPDHDDPPFVLGDDTKCDDIENTAQDKTSGADNQADVFQCPPEPSEPSEPSVKDRSSSESELDRPVLELQLDEPGAPPASLAVVFAHWKLKTGYKRSKLTDERRRAVTARLREGYSVEDLKRAVDGCMLTPHNRGATDGARHDDLELICRNGSQVERFMRNAENPPRGTTQDPNDGIIGRAAAACVVCGDPAGANIAADMPGCYPCIGKFQEHCEAVGAPEPWAIAGAWVAQQHGIGASP